MEHGFKPSRQIKSRKTLPEQERTDWQALLNQAIKLHQRAVAGDQKACQNAYSLLLKIRSRVARDSVVEAYLGSTLVLLGRDEKNPEERIRKVLQGLKILDQAIAIDRNHLDIRFLRAYVCFHLPNEVFHRLSTAIEDFQYLLKKYQQEPGIFSPTQFKELTRDLKEAQNRL